MNPFSFLSQVTVAAVEAPKKVVAKTSRVLQPENADLRIWNTGAVYPSNALIAEFNLEYALKDATDAGNGVDIIDTQEMPSIRTPQRFIALSFTNRKEGKIDLFGLTRYNEDNTPIASVATQGSALYGKETLLPLLKEVYGVEPNEEGFIDLNIVREMPITSPNGIYQFPKVVARGPKKGEITYVRRENQTVYAVAPVVEEVTEEVEELPASQDNPSAEPVAQVTETEVTETTIEASSFVLEGSSTEVEEIPAEEAPSVVDVADVAVDDPFADVPFQAPTATSRI